MTSCAQDELWFRQTLVPDSPAHTLCRAYHVRGDLDVAALRSAWRAVVRRHDILRTTLVMVDGLPVQSIAPDGAAPEAFSDLGAIALLDAAPHAAEAAVAGLGAELAGRPMDLAAGPLARLAVARLAPGEHAVLLLAHEAVADDRSMAILANELSAAYAAEAGGRPAHEVLPPASAQYADYARWQHDRRTTPEFRRLLDWWTARLRPLPPRLSLRPTGPGRRPVLARRDRAVHLDRRGAGARRAGGGGGHHARHRRAGRLPVPAAPARRGADGGGRPARLRAPPAVRRSRRPVPQRPGAVRRPVRPSGLPRGAPPDGAGRARGVRPR
nr:condensation domain-containing protein [Microbispora sp. GKU 823]